MTYDVAARVSVPIVGMGGIACGRDALDFLAAGATCVAVGTESFRDPAAGSRVRDELSDLLAKRGFKSAREALATLRSSPPE
jgi:dihydroorotate dehydrogenase (NAD+) catalytic subunit